MSDFECCAVAAEHRQPSWLAGLIAKHGEPIVAGDFQAAYSITEWAWPHEHASVRIGSGFGRSYVAVTNGDRTADLGADKALTDADISAVVALAGLCDDPAPVPGSSRRAQDDPMPVFVIKAKDEFALAAIRAYRALCDEHGLRDQAREVGKAHREMREWRVRHPELTKLPDHKHMPAGESQASEPDDVGKCPQCGKQTRSHSRGCSWCGFGRPSQPQVTRS